MPRDYRPISAAADASGCETGEKIISPGRVFRLCPVRHVLFLCAAAVIGLYFLLRGNRALMDAVSGAFVRPYHRLAGTISSLFGFSLAELICTLLVAALLAYLVRTVILLVRRGERRARAYRSAVSLLTAGALLYAGFCFLWGVYYYAESFEERSGIIAADITAKQLESVTKRFADLVNAYADRVQRDEAGCFTASRDALFERSATLYQAVTQKFPCLEGPELRAKPMVFSRLMSAINFTGFFSPFTGEANLNVESPLCLLPATIAHELAHQRGVAAEDEANFVAVLACMEAGDPDFVYSAALLAYIHLGNALYDVNYEAFRQVYVNLAEGVRADLDANRQYWAKYESKVSEASEAVYTGFLESYGQELGMKSYGACVDLLAAYYGTADISLPSPGSR
jgi:hypothetical protein